MTAIWGVDVASYQSVAQVAGAVKSGAGFVLVKATEGLGYTNPLYARQVGAARAGGAKVGHYHFAHCANDPIAEARYFLAHADIKVGDAIMLDLEYQKDGSSWPKRASYAAAWLSFVAVTERCRPIRYVNQTWLIGILNAAQQAQRQVFESMPLMIATSDLPAGKPGIIQPWVLHQYSTAGGIDHDLLVAPWDSFAVQPVHAVTPPTPVPVNATRRFAMLIFAMGDDYVFATGFRHGVLTRDVAEAKAAIARGEVVKVLGGPAATALGLSAGQHGNTQVIIGQTFHDTAVAAAALMV